MNRRTFLASILAPFLVPLLPKDWRASKNLCKVNPVRSNPNPSAAMPLVDGPTGNQGPCGGDPTAYGAQPVAS